MNPLKNSRVAWSVAVAALALWASSVPLAWGEVTSRAAQFFDDTAEEDSSQTTLFQTGGSLVVPSGEGDTAQGIQCVPLPPSIAEVIPPVPTVVTPPAAHEGTFQICNPDPAVATDIERLIAARGFSATLRSGSSGCAELAIRVTSPASTGSASSTLSVGLGSAKNLTVKI